MQLSFYDASVICYQQMLESTANLMDKGQQHANANGMALEEITDYRLHETMLPFSFQIISFGTTPTAPCRACARACLCRHQTNPGSTMQDCAGWLMRH